MPRFMIERSIPGAADMDASELREASKKSRSVLRDLGPTIQWVESYVLDDRMTCVFIADNEDLIREHARRSGFPADRILPVHNMIDPTTAD
jgi:hypothetical protein